MYFCWGSVLHESNGYYKDVELHTDVCIVEICGGLNWLEDVCPQNTRYVKIPLNGFGAAVDAICKA